MPTLQWDRLLETSAKQGGDILLIAGSPPLLRMGGGLAPLQVPPLDVHDLDEMAHTFTAPPAVTEEANRYQYHQADGYKYLDVTYRDGQVFRAAVFGQPSPSLIVLMRLQAPRSNDG